MSSVRGSSRGRGRGSANAASTRGRALSTARGQIANNSVPHGNVASASAPGRFPRANFRGSTRGASRARGNAVARQPTRPGAFSPAQTKGNWQERYQQLTRARERERADAIKQGLIADPDKPRALSEAITPVGTCQDMCAEYERLERVVQKDVWPEETDPDQSVYGSADKEPDEPRMVKKFRRAAAGLEEQLPSDLRPPHVLERTCEYLFDEVIGNAPSLGHVHHFVWDRTRAIRNDFSIQQVTKPDELRTAIRCYERIARFHILSLHQLASAEKPYSKYDWQQEREQLDRTLLSLMQYYEDSRSKIESPNEAEFRAYCVIFQLQDRTPDLEDRMQSWAPHILLDRRVRTALDVYMTACNIADAQGPLKPRVHHLIARQDWQHFWMLVASKEVSYLMACVAEIYFNLVRRTVLNALFRAFRQSSTVASPDWTIDVLCSLLAFDEEDDVYTFCERFGFSFKERPEDGQQYLDLTSVKGRTLPDSKAGMPNQIKTSLVEHKRFGRSLPAVINGLSVRQATEAGLVQEEENDGEMEDGACSQERNMDAQGVDDGESLFMPQMAVPEDRTPFANANHASTPDSKLSLDGTSSGFAFGKPSTFGQASIPVTYDQQAKNIGSSPGNTSPFAQPAGIRNSNQQSPAAFSFGKPSVFGQPTGTPSAFSFGKPSTSHQVAAANTQDQEQSSSSSAFGKPAFGQRVSGEEQQKLESSPFNTQPSFGRSVVASSEQPGTSEISRSSGPKAAPPTLPFPSASAPAPYAGSPRSTGDSAANQNTHAAVVGNAQPPSTPSGLFSAPEEAVKLPSQANANVTSAFQFSLGSPASSTNQGPSTKSSTFSFLQPKPEQPAPATKEKPASAFGKPAADSVSTFTLPPVVSSTPIQSQTSATSSIDSNLLTQPSSSPAAAPKGVKRASFSGDTRPKKPSPLSNSITADDDTSALLTNGEPRSVGLGQTAKFASLAANKSFTEATPEVRTGEAAADDSKANEEDFDAIVNRVGDELFYDEVAGILRQYVEFTVGKTIKVAHEDLITELLEQEAKEYRLFVLHVKYGKRWKEVFWQRRLARSGRERRERKQRRLREGFDHSGLRSSHSIDGSSRATSVVPYEFEQLKKSEGSMGNTHSRLTNGTSHDITTEGEQHNNVNGKRPPSSGSAVSRLHQSRHKRMKSTSYVDDRGRIAKPSYATELGDNMLKRSSFLAFSTGSLDNGIRNTTKSTYFKQKALGVNRADQTCATQSKKRQRSDSLDGSSQMSPPSLHTSRTSITGTLPLSPNPAKRWEANDEDEALLARVRAARQNLEESTSFFKSEMAKEERSRKSTNSQRPDTESPSMDIARAEARIRASLRSSENERGNKDRDVPAYRMRESRFVPKEQYGLAIHRARQIRESRSRDISRSGSRNEHERPSMTQTRYTTEEPGKTQTITGNLSGNNGPSMQELHHPAPMLGSEIYQSPSLGAQGLASFADTTVESNEAESFSQPHTSHSPSAFAFQPSQALHETPGDFTIARSKIDQSLAESFGHTSQHITPAFEPDIQSSFIPMHEDPFVHSQPILLLSDDGEEDDVGIAQFGYDDPPNGTETEVPTEDGDFIDSAVDEDRDEDYTKGNPFAALADPEEYDEQDDEDEQGTDDRDSQFNGFFQDDEAGNGDNDDRSEYDEDGEEYDDEEEDGDEDDLDAERTPWQPLQYGRAPVAKPTPDPALQDAGNTQDDAIELSD